MMTHSNSGLTGLVLRPRHTAIGVTGISLISGHNRCGRRHYFSVYIRNPWTGRRNCRRFCLETLGREEAWRRAVACRAAHELRVNARRIAAGLKPLTINGN